MENKKFKKLLNISLYLLIIGGIFSFINLPVGLLFIFSFLISAINLHINYPQELKDFQKQQKEIREKNIKNKSMPEYLKGDFKFFNIKHIEGIEYAKENENCEITISTQDISFYNKNDDFLASFKYDEIKKCTLYEEIEQENKRKSPVTRTIVGGVLLGPVGAVVSGVSGVTPTIKEHKKYYIEFQFKNSDIMENIVISGEFNVLKQIEQSIKITV